MLIEEDGQAEHRDAGDDRVEEAAGAGLCDEKSGFWMCCKTLLIWLISLQSVDCSRSTRRLTEQRVLCDPADDANVGVMRGAELSKLVVCAVDFHNKAMLREASERAEDGDFCRARDVRRFDGAAEREEDETSGRLLAALDEGEQLVAQSAARTSPSQTNAADINDAACDRALRLKKFVGICEENRRLARNLGNMRKVWIDVPLEKFCKLQIFSILSDCSFAFDRRLLTAFVC